MTTNLAKCAAEHGQMAKIRPSDGCGGKAITTAAQFEYDRHGFEGYLGNVGSITFRQRTLQISSRGGPK